MTENLVASPSQLIPSASDTNGVFPLQYLLCVAMIVLFVMVYGLVEFCWSCMKNRLDILPNQDHHPHDVERRQVSGKELPATVAILRLSIIQIDETTEYFSNGCAICLDDFQKGEDCFVFSSCKHVFHSICLKQWLEQNQSCPLCRNSVYDDILLC